VLWVVPTALKTTEGTGDSVVISEPHVVESDWTMGWSLGSCVGGVRREMVVMVVYRGEEMSVARIWEPTAPVEPKIRAVVMLV